MWKSTLLGDTLLFITALLLGAAVNVAAFVYVMGKYVQPFPIPVVVEKCPQQQQRTPSLM